MNDQQILNLIKLENAKMVAQLKKDAYNPNRVLRYKDIKNKVGLSRTTIDRYIEAGKFPKKIKISYGLCGWLDRDIEDWIKEHHRNRK